MKKFILAFICIMLSVVAFSQEKNTALLVGGQFTKTIRDATIGNNPWGMGPTIQVFVNNHRKLRFTAELTAEGFLEDDKVMRIYWDDVPFPDFDVLIGLYAGAAYFPTRSISISLAAGPVMANTDVRFGIKPSVGVYLSRSERWLIKASFLKIPNRERRYGIDFNGVSLSLAARVL